MKIFNLIVRGPKTDLKWGSYDQNCWKRPNTYGLFGWGGFGPRDLDLRAQIQILCLDDLKPFGFGFGPNPSWIAKVQIHGFQMTCIVRNLGNPLLRSVPLARVSLTQSRSHRLSGMSLSLHLSLSLSLHLSLLSLRHFSFSSNYPSRSELSTCIGEFKKWVLKVFWGFIKFLGRRCCGTFSVRPIQSLVSVLVQIWLAF